MLFTISGMAQIHYGNTSSSWQKNSSAIGYGSTASGEKSFASGITSIASGICSTTLGQFNEASGNYAVTIGCNLKATGMRSMIIGSGYSNSDQLKLKNSKLNSLMVGFLSQYPTLFVSTSPSYNKTGRVGIGNVTAPDAKLHIRSDDGSSATLYLQPYHWDTTANAQIWMGNKNNGISADFGTGMVYHTETNHLFEGGNVFVTNGAVGIGTNQTNGYKLAVNGKILAEEIKVTEDVPGSDYVFEKDYPLLKLTEVEKYVQKNKHLPEVKSAEEFKTQGYKIGEMDDVLLRKIEELTLYTIKQQKMIEQQAKMLETQQKQIDELIKTR